MTKLLRQLGSTDNAVAATLLAGGHLGERRQCDLCPVANYLAAGWTPAVVSVSPGKALAGWRGTETGADNMHVYVRMPRPVFSFVVDFDLGGRPELVKTDAAGGES